MPPLPLKAKLSGFVLVDDHCMLMTIRPGSKKIRALDGSKAIHLCQRGTDQFVCAHSFLESGVTTSDGNEVGMNSLVLVTENERFLSVAAPFPSQISLLIFKASGR